MRIPRQTAIEVTNFCNLKCKDCPQGDEEKGAFHQGFMDFGLFTKIVNSIDYETYIVLWLNGEPLLHPRYFDMVDYIDRYTDIPWTITTNGVLLTEDGMDRLVESANLYQVIFSIDGYYKDTFEKLRPGANLYEVGTKVFNMLTKREKAGKTRDDFTIGVKITEKGMDYEEIEKFIEFWLDKVDYVVVGKFLGRENEEQLRKYPCRYSDDMLIEIRWDGTIVPCSYNLKATEELPIDLGKVQDYPDVLSAYNSSKFKAFRKANYVGKYPYPCNTCGFAYTGDGFEGKVKFRKNERNHYDQDIYYSEDYYNRMWSLSPPLGGSSRMRAWHPDTLEV